MLKNQTINFSLLILGHFCFLFGVVGLFLPILPTTPFLLLATFLYSKSSPNLHTYMTNHKLLGPPIKDWEERKVISLKAKILAISMILLTVIFKIEGLDINFILKVIIILILLILVLFIATRKSR